MRTSTINASGNSDAEVKRLNLPVATLIAGWFSTAAWLSIGGVFDPLNGASPIAMPMAIFLPVIAFTAASMMSDSFRAWIAVIDLRAILLLHTWRMLGLGFLFVYALNGLPAVFAFPAGVGDAAAAAWATYLCFELSRQGSVSRRQLALWNGFGLLDFALAVAIGTISRPGPAGVLETTVTTHLMTVPPLSFIPTFVVPLLVITHLIVAMRLRGAPDGIRPDRK